MAWFFFIRELIPVASVEAVVYRNRSRVWEAFVMVEGKDWALNEPQLERRDASSGRESRQVGK